MNKVSDVTANCIAVALRVMVIGEAASTMKVQVTPYVHAWPAPAVLVGCGTVSKPNLITISWFGTVCSNPPLVSISIRPSRHSFGLVQGSGEFTLNLPRATDLLSVKFCGERSGRDTDKFRCLKLTPLPCPPLEQAPMVAESFFSFGCLVRNQLPLGTHHIFIAEIVSAYAEQPLIRPQGKPDPRPEDQLVWVGGKYWGLHLIGD